MCSLPVSTPFEKDREDVPLIISFEGMETCFALIVPVACAVAHRNAICPSRNRFTLLTAWMLGLNGCWKMAVSSQVYNSQWIECL